MHPGSAELTFRSACRHGFSLNCVPLLQLFEIVQIEQNSLFLETWHKNFAYFERSTLLYVCVHTKESHRKFWQGEISDIPRNILELRLFLERERVCTFFIRNRFISNLVLDSLKLKKPLKLQGKS